MNFKQKLAFGRVGEERISNWRIRSRGATVLPVYKIEDGDQRGPRLFADKLDLIVPDLLVWPEKSRPIWVETKRKTVFSWHRNTGTWQTGIDTYLFEQYKKVAEKTGLQIWLLFLHENDRSETRNEPWPCPTGMFGQALGTLEQIGREHGAMLYWKRLNLIHLASLLEIAAAQGER